MNILARTRNALRGFVRGFSGYDLTGGSGRWPAQSSGSGRCNALASFHGADPGIPLLVRG